MNPLDDDMNFQRRKAHEERRGLLVAGLMARGMDRDTAEQTVGEYTIGVLDQAIDMTFDPEKPYFGMVRKAAREGWWWRGLQSARHAIQRLEQWEYAKIDRLTKAKQAKEDKR